MSDNSSNSTPFCNNPVYIGDGSGNGPSNGSGDDSSGFQRCIKCKKHYLLTRSRNPSLHHQNKHYCPTCIPKKHSDTNNTNDTIDGTTSKHTENGTMTHNDTVDDTINNNRASNDLETSGKRRYIQLPDIPPNTINTINSANTTPNSTNNTTSSNKIERNDLMRLLLIFDTKRSDFAGIQPNMPSNTSTSTSTSQGNEPPKSPGKPNLDDAPFEWIGSDVRTIDDLIKLGKQYDMSKRVKTNLDMYQLSKLVSPLEELQDMIGMKSVKERMFHMSTYHLQGLVTEKDHNLYNTCIMGDSGLGKTELSGIICRLYHGIGLLKNPEPIIADKNHFEGKYLGHTVDKVANLVKQAREEGRALVTDEAYMILDKGGKDTFGKQAIDHMVKEMGRDGGSGFIWITMGYEKAMQETFFKANSGLPRRFPIILKMEEPTGDDLAAIFLRTCRKQNWKCNVDKSVLDELFTSHRDYMPHHGGSVLNLITHCKHAHSRRLLSVKTLEELEVTKKIINLDDLKAGIEAFGKNVAANFLRLLERQEWECSVDEPTLNKMFTTEFTDPIDTISKINSNTTTTDSINIDSNDIDSNNVISVESGNSDSDGNCDDSEKGIEMHTGDQLASFIAHCKEVHVDRLHKLNALETLETTKKNINAEDIKAAIKSYKKSNGKKPGEGDNADHVKKYPNMYC